MKKRKISIAIFLTSIALLGVIITQSYWVTNSVRLRSDLLDQNLTVGLKRVVNQIMLLQSNLHNHQDSLSEDEESVSEHKYFIQHLDPAIIDTMIQNEFRNSFPDQRIYYAIFEIETKEFVICNCTGLDIEILESPHQAPISCIFQEDQFMLSVLFPRQQQFIIHELQINILSSIIFTLIIIFGFWYIITILLQQKKLSEMKHDFVNNMTHELKTPIATISVASEMLMNDAIVKQPEKVTQYAGIIHEENIRLRDQVDHVLTVARLERSDFRLKFDNLNAHDIIKDVIRKFELKIAQRGGIIHTRLNAANMIIYADNGHFANVIQNLIDNAIKYSPETFDITVSTHSSNEGLTIYVEDKGIGIEPQNLEKIFLQFHRVSTGDVHDVKGFGIGLYYVKKIVGAHGGTIQVKSTPGKGSSFAVFMPFKKTDELKKNEKSY